MTTVSIDHKARLYKVNQAAPDQEPTAGSPDLVIVQFNPASLSYSVQNTLEKKGRDANAKQYVAQTTAKLEFDLTFDSTHDGGDVRRETDRIKQFLNPGDEKAKDKAPPLVGFRWGSFSFKGIVESFKENLEFFSAEGVPLRSTLKIGLASQDAKDVFAKAKFSDGDAAAAAAADVSLISSSGGAAGVAAAAGRPGAARALAAANGLESLRASAAVAVSGGVELKAAVGFSAGGSAGLGVGGGIGAGLAGAIGGGVGAGIGASTGASSLQAFAGLGASKLGAGAGLNVSALLPAASSSPLAGDFALGGRAVGAASLGLKADMGAGARIKFD
jgi:hypothetical protein